MTTPNPAPAPEVTQRRLAALRQYAIMDTPPERAFDDLAELASYICGTPIATITLLDADRQWFKARVGIDSIETPISDAFCAHAIQMDDVMVVEDAKKDERFAVNPYVTGNPNIRFYAGAPLVTPEGVPLGTICAIDCVPRKLPEEQRKALSALARQVVSQMELRRTIASLEGAMRDMAAARKEIEQLQDILPLCAWCRKVRDDADFWHHVDDYLADRTRLRFKHGICPECSIKQFGARTPPTKGLAES